MRNPIRVIHSLSGAVALALLVAGCGGGDSAGTAPEPVAAAPVVPVIPPVIPPVVAAEATFPTGLAVGSPAEVSASATVASIGPRRTDPLRYAADFGRGLWSAIRNDDGRQLAKLAAQAIPISAAHAATAKSPDLASDIAIVQKVLTGDTEVSIGDVLNFDKLFTGSTNAACYGPSMKYSQHEDAAPSTPNSGTLPGGDLGIWLEYDGTQPCVAAQLGRRVRGIKAQTQQGLLMMAAMRRTVTTSTSLSMPTASSMTDLTSEFESMLRAQPQFGAFDVGVASISRDSTGTIYTYRLTLHNGLTGASARSGEITMIHTPGSSSSAFTGVIQVAAFSLSNDAAMGCNDVKDLETGLYQTANVGTLKYSRADTAVAFGHRSGNYCGHPASFSAAAFGAAVASYTSGGELDPAVSVTGGIRGTTKGWVGNFARFAGDFNLDHVDGDFRYAWQAGPQDGKSRMLALNTTFNTATEVRSLKGYFAFGADISSSNHDMLGMICNWAGPGNSHTTQALFQSQIAQLSASASEFTIPSGGSKITYAPTKSCSSTTTLFDANIDNTIAAGEGAATLDNLDAPDSLVTVEKEIESRGFVSPTLY